MGGCPDCSSSSRKKVDRKGNLTEGNHYGRGLHRGNKEELMERRTGGKNWATTKMDSKRVEGKLGFAKKWFQQVGRKKSRDYGRH